MLPATAYADSIWGEFETIDEEAVPLMGEAEDDFVGRIQFGYIAASGNSARLDTFPGGPLSCALPR